MSAGCTCATSATPTSSAPPPVLAAPLALPAAGSPEGGWYVLRAYRAGWRSDGEIRYELDALNHLAARGVVVSTPVTPRDGEALRSVRAPEGRRQLVLFTFAPGDEDATRDDRARLYGRAAGAVHAASADFASPHPRSPIDLDALFERPLRALAPLLRERPRERRALSALARRLRAHAGAFPFARLEAGFCHGDLHGGNAGVAGDALTLFDFDLCGPGWRAYDVAVFRWGLTGGWLEEAEAERRWGLFLEGYSERRRLAAPDLDAVPFFMLLRQFWFMGLWGANGRDWGYRWPTSDGFLEQSLRLFRTWEPRL